MSKVSKEIECLTRLQGMTGQLEELLQFLKLEGLVDDNQMKSVKLAADHAKEVQGILRDLSKSGKIQLLQYEWTILPVETIVVTVVTDRNQKEFSYGL
jgi:hypothetical protein